ncbi:MAG TPA: sodium:solute symporter family protein [Longimicrobiales bacterium]|nr:sodium:solute symporter family protein [Longimicrobiales bacterium]
MAQHEPGRCHRQAAPREQLGWTRRPDRAKLFRDRDILPPDPESLIRTLAPLDWGIVLSYLALALAVGVLVSRNAGRSIDSYFVAGRGLPWWWLGTSMVATTFAADTPLVVSGLVAEHGIAGNWFWWSWAISHVSMAVVFAALWRRARVVTDAELLELRYTGPSAVALRGFKAVFFALLINGIVLGWVIRAMVKIAAPFVHWEAWLGADAVAAFGHAWPDALAIGGPGDTITVLVLFGMIALYSSLGGIRGVILTDLLQFALALVASITFAWIAVDSVGGMGGLVTGLEQHYDADRVLAFVPSTGAAWLPLQVFLIYIAVQWWAQYFSDGSGYLAQRLFTARDDAHAEHGALWFTVANYALRTWPWVLIGLVALVAYPLGAPVIGAAGDMVAADREMAYPVLMAELLPVGLLGVLFASLLAAFMSTVDTHLNWGASYLVSDVYRRFARPRASQRELVLVARIAVFALAALAVVVAARIDSIEKAWRFFVALGAGLGLPSMLRWLWWRVNAWTEIAGMVVATTCALVLYPLFPDARDEYLLLVIVGLAMAAALIATLVTPAVPRDHLARFVQRVRPPGWWAGLPGAAPGDAMAWTAGAWIAGNAAVFGLTFGIGHALFGRLAAGILMLVVGAGGIVATIAAVSRARRHTMERDG